MSEHQKDVLKAHCSDDDDFVLRSVKGNGDSQIFYNLEGERLTSFSISPADCPRW